MAETLHSETVHQQEGVTLDTFSAMTGLSMKQLYRYANAGRIIGARKHPLTKKWWVYFPAKILDWCQKPAREVLPSRVEPSSGSGAIDAFGIDAGTYPTDAENAELLPLLANQQAPQARAGGGCSLPVFASRQVKQDVRVVRLAASREPYFCRLTGLQLVLMECALLHEAEILRQRHLALRDMLEFDHPERAESAEELKTLFDALHALKLAANGKGAAS